MKCLICQNPSTQVIDSRDDGKTVRRRRQCIKCRERFTTYEKLERPSIVVIKRDGRIEPFDRSKLLNGITLSFEKRPFSQETIEDLVDEIEHKIISLRLLKVKSSKIGDLVLNRLKKIDEVAYLRFISVYKCFGNARRFIKEADKILNK